MDGIISFIDEVCSQIGKIALSLFLLIIITNDFFVIQIENDDGVWVRLSTESIRQHCQPGWYPLEAWCLQFNQHIDKTLLHPVIEPSSVHQDSIISSANNQEECGIDSETTPTSELHHLTAITPEIIPRKSPIKKAKPSGDDRPIETNPFKAIAQSQDGEPSDAPLLSSKLSRQSRNPFEKLTKRSGKVIEDADDLEEYASQDDCEKSFVSSISSSPNYNQSKHSQQQQQQSNIGTWTAGVMGGSSSKLQAIQKWFKSESFDSKDPSKKRGDFTELASVSVRDLVKAIGGTSNDSKGNGNSPQQLSQCSSPISIPFSKSTHFLF